jgi:predicted acyltransferase
LSDLKQNFTAQTSSPERITAIDQFRGFAILLMILADFLNNINTVPSWLKHAPDIGYTIIDLVAPLFIFAIGLTYGLSFRRRLDQYGPWKTYNHFFSRNLALIGLGFLITLGGVLSKNYPPTANWGLLQALGAAGLITLPLIKIKAKYRWIFGILLLGLYQVLLSRYWLSEVFNAVHNGPQGALSWGAMLVIATSMGDFFFGETRNRRYFAWLSIAILILGSLLAIYVPISKHRASASYMLVSLGLSGLIFFAFHILDSHYRIHIPLLVDFGKNPLLLYLLHGLFLALFVLPPFPVWYFEAPLGLVVIQAVIFVAVLSWIVRFFNRRGWYLTI